MKRWKHFIMAVIVFSMMGISSSVLAQSEFNAKIAVQLETYRQREAQLDLTPPKLSANPLFIRDNRTEINLLDGVTAFDNQNDEVVLAVPDYQNAQHVPISQFKNGLQYVLYTATDSAGNVGYLLRAVIIRDNSNNFADLIAPEVMSAPLYVTAGSLSLEEFIENKENLGAYDNQAGDLAYAYQFDLKKNETFDITKAGRYLVHWEVEDGQHNRAIVKQWVIVLNPADLQ